MRIRMRTIWASAYGCFGPGQLVDLPDDVGQQLLASRSAELVDAAGGAATPRAVTGRQPHQAPPAAATASRRGAPERATADPHRGSGRPDPDDEHDDDDELDDELEEPADDEAESDDECTEDAEAEEPADPMGLVPAEPAAKPAKGGKGAAPKGGKRRKG